MADFYLFCSIEQKSSILTVMYSSTTSRHYLHFLFPVLMEIITVNKYTQLETGDTHGTVCLAIITNQAPA